MRLFHWFRRKRSGEIAKKRLKILLVSDRADCSSELINSIKTDIVQVLSKYMDVDQEHLEVTIVQRPDESTGENRPAVVARVPFKEINKVIC